MQMLKCEFAHLLCRSFVVSTPSHNKMIVWNWPDNSTLKGIQTMHQLSIGHAWQHTLTLLGGGSVLHDGVRYDVSHAANGISRSTHRDSMDAAPARRAKLALVDFCKDKLISVSWSDPTSGHYTEQLWRLCIARKRGQCALTGNDILRGDKIYRPFVRGVMPINADWNILASALEGESDE
jgi:hypothetical protein